MFKILLSALLVLGCLNSLASAGPAKSRKEILKSQLTGGVNGGTACATCTIMVALTEQLAIVYNQTVDQSIEQLCSFLPKGIFRLACEQAIEEFGPVIITGLYTKKTPDVICHAIDVCRTDKGQPECAIFPKPKGSTIALEVYNFQKFLASKNIDIQKHRVGKGICDNKIIKPICDYFNNIFNNHVPGEDIDGDGHSEYPGFRGSSWKGKDCNDFSYNTKPGVRPTGSDKVEDSNCNGIFGQMPNSSMSYEDYFCKDSGQLGVGILGDSISAHFHIPEQWLDATQISSTVFDNLLFILENELDWPELSTSTGYMNSTWPVTTGPTRSTYLNMLNRNRCNHRDYQNVAVNGARTGAMIDIVKSLARNQKKDQPMLLGYSLVGNDVCNGHPDTFDHMTKPDEFYNNVITVMQYLDTVLPKGSHVFMTGLANGSVLFDALHDRIYPIGRVRNDVKYTDIYTYLSCLQLSPCNGWMTVNATERQMTTDYAMMLSGLVKNVSESFTFKNFDMAYMDLPIAEIFDRWQKMGGEPWQLIEPVDGFHMNQIANALSADVIWETLSTKYPSWIGEVNPHNDEIIKIFGDQGGH